MKTKKRLVPFALLSLVFVTACASSGAASSSTPEASSLSPSVSSNASSNVSSSAVYSSSASIPAVETVLTKKVMDIYLSFPANKKSCNLYFTDQQPDIPFVDVQDFIDFFDAEGLPITFSLSASSHIGTFANGTATATLDFDRGLYTMNDFQHLFALGGKSSALEVVSLTAADETGAHHYLKRADGGNTFIAGSSWSIDLASYQIPLYYSSSKAYLPLTTFSDLFINPIGAAMVYNTKAVFFAADLTPLLSLYYLDEIQGERSEKLAQFTYHEFCMNMDHNYGLKEVHGITTFDDFISKTGLKSDLLSKDAKVSSTAYSKFILGYLDDSHSGVNLSSYLCGNVPMILLDYYGPSMTEKNNAAIPYSTARAAAYSEGIKPYEVVGNDTAVITFDQFATATSNYYTKAPTAEDAAKDTMALVSYANAQIASNSAIKNVVLDLSLNGGGEIDAAAFLLSWMLGGVTLHTMDPLDGAKASITYYGDTNFDGVFDSNDFLTGKKMYCLTSGSSFSCGNLVPSLFKEAGAATLMGRTSGGGACVVGHSSLADGTFFQLSSQMVLCTRKNGSYYSVDRGAEPDVTIDDPATFYNRTALRAKILSL